MAEWFKAPVLKTGIEKSIWGSNPYASASYSWIVQMVERCSVKANVTGSSPVPGASEGIAKWLRQLTLTQLFDGSTPSTLANFIYSLIVLFSCFSGFYKGLYIQIWSL